MCKAVCQCPYSGLSHFYTLPIWTKFKVDGLCQCPWSGLSHFYTTSAQGNVWLNNCVNALGRAYPISTVSLPKPFKINGFRVRFQGVIVRKFWQFGFFEQKRACLQFVHIYAYFYSTTHPAKTQAKFQNVLTCHCDSAVRPNSSEKNPPDDRKRLPANHIFTGSPCGMRDLNPHALRHKNLNLACLPIPSIPHAML